MRIVLQRVSSARCIVDGAVTGEIGPGFVALIGFGTGDDDSSLDKMADKMLGLRVFADAQNKFNLALADIGGGVLAISQFTLYADCRKGRRPSFVDALAPAAAEDLYHKFVAMLRSRHAAGPVGTGVFGAMMQIHLVNDGPVTILLDSREL